MELSPENIQASLELDPLCPKAGDKKIKTEAIKKPRS